MVPATRLPATLHHVGALRRQPQPDTRPATRRDHPMTGMYELQDHPRHGRVLTRKQGVGTSYLHLPDREGVVIGAWVELSPFHGTLLWEWVITNMPVTVVTGMSSGYCRTRWGARRAANRALRFWNQLGYTVNWQIREDDDA